MGCQVPAGAGKAGSLSPILVSWSLRLPRTVRSRKSIPRADAISGALPHSPLPPGSKHRNVPSCLGRSSDGPSVSRAVAGETRFGVMLYDHRSIPYRAVPSRTPSRAPRSIVTMVTVDTWFPPGFPHDPDANTRRRPSNEHARIQLSRADVALLQRRRVEGRV